MNNNGKSNIIFLIFIPLFFIVALIILDTVFSYVQNKNLKSVTEKVISEVIKSDEINETDYIIEIKNAYIRNGIDTDMLDIEISNNKLVLVNQHRYFGIFSSLSNKMGDKTEIEILGIKFILKKNSVARVNVSVENINDDELVFEYSE